MAKGGVKVQAANVEIRESRVATEAPTEAIVEREVPVEGGVGFATLARNNTARQSCCIQDVGILPNGEEKSRLLPEMVRGSSR